MPEELAGRRVERAVQEVDRELDAVVAVRARYAVSPVIDSSDADLDRIAGRDLHAAELVRRAVDGPARRDVPPAPVSPPSSLQHAAATSVSAPRSANIARHLRFFIQPPSEGVLRSWSYANTHEERPVRPLSPLRRVLPITFRRSRATRAVRRSAPVREGVRNADRSRTVRADGRLRPRGRRKARASLERDRLGPPPAAADQRAPHDDAVGERARLGGLRGLGDPHTHEEREVRERAQAPHQLRGRLRPAAPARRSPRRSRRSRRTPARRPPIAPAARPRCPGAARNTGATDARSHALDPVARPRPRGGRARSRRPRRHRRTRRRNARGPRARRGSRRS